MSLSFQLSTDTHTLSGPLFLVAALLRRPSASQPMLMSLDAISVDFM